MNAAAKLNAFIKESVQELKKVNWPTKDETVKYTLFVVMISVIISLFLGLWDSVFVSVVKFLVS